MIFQTMLQIVLLTVAADLTAHQEIQKITPEKNLSDSIRKLSQDFTLRDIFSIPQGESKDTYFFFVPQAEDGEDRYFYVYDKDFNRMLCLPKKDDLASQIIQNGKNSEDWLEILNRLILDKEKDIEKGYFEGSSPLRIRRISEDWVEFSLGGRHIVLPQGLIQENAVSWQEAERNLLLGQEIVDKETSLAPDYAPDDLVRISQKWNFHAEDYPKFLREYVVTKLEQMLQNAEDQGIQIRVFSAYRSYESQRYLYLQAVSRSGSAQNSVAKHGHSEHQLGTAVDLCNLDPGSILNSQFDRTREGRWLSENSQKFGFSQSYTKENQQETGYMPESWHFRYLGVERLLPSPEAVTIRRSPFSL